MKLTHILFPFLQEEQEKKEEEAPAEENTQEEAPAEEATQEEAPAEENTQEEAPAEENAQEEAPAEENAQEEAPAEENTQEETPPVKKKILSILFSFFQKMIHNKVFSEFMMIFFIAFGLCLLFLTYGQITKKEHCVSFETIYAQLESRKVAKPFSDGDIDKLVSYIFTELPAEDYEKNTAKDLRKDATKTIKKEYGHLFKKRSIKLTRVTCEYQKEKDKTKTQLICTCYFTFSETEDFCLILKKRASNRYEISLSSPKGDTTSYTKINALFSYITYTYENPSDYEIAALLTKEKPDYKKAASYFTMDASKPDKSTTYQETIVKRLRRLTKKELRLEQVFFSPYSYDQQKKEKNTSLILRFTDLETGTSIILYQPVLIGLYGYQPLKNTALCSSELPYDISDEIRQIFSY